MNLRPPWFFCLGLVLPALVTGCSNEEEGPANTGPPAVTVAHPVERPVVPYAEFTGRTDAVESVEIRARVTGYLDKIFFKPGADVKKGDPLFLIDPRTYKAELDKARGDLTQNEARKKRLEADYQRGITLFAKKSISREELDKIAGDLAEAEAAVKAASAALERYRLNLEFTLIKAPISGKMSRPLITEGNLVSADKTLLTTLISQDKTYVYFDVDENSMLRYEKLVREGKLKRDGDKAPAVLMGLANEDGFPHQGKIDFKEVQLNRGSGTIQVRGIFPNAEGVLKPNLFVRVKIPLGQAQKTLMIPEDAVGSDQGQTYVYVINDKKRAEYRKVKLGPVQEGFQAVESGLKANEWIVVKGLQRVRDGAPVKPEEPKETKEQGPERRKKP